MEAGCSAPSAASAQLRLPLLTCRNMEKLCSPCLASRSRTPAWSSACTRMYSSILSGRSSMTWPRRRGCKVPQPPSAEMDASACSQRGGEKLLSVPVVKNGGDLQYCLRLGGTQGITWIWTLMVLYLHGLSLSMAVGSGELDRSYRIERREIVLERR